MWLTFYVIEPLKSGSILNYQIQQCLSRYFNGLNEYFHLINSNSLIFNNHPREKLEELRSDTLDIRRSLNDLLEEIGMY